MENIEIDHKFMMSKVVEYLIQTGNEDLVEEVPFLPHEDIASLFLSAYLKGEIRLY